MTITVNNPQSHTDGGLSASSITLSSYAVPAGTDKILIVGIGIEDFSGGIETITGVTHNSVSMTSRMDFTHPSGFSRYGFFDLQLGSTTPSGNIVVSFSGTVDAANVTALTLAGAKQQAPEATQTVTATTQPINTSITTVTASAMIVDLMVDGNSGTASITQGPDQVQDISVQSGGLEIKSGMSHRLGGAAGSYTLGWSMASVNRIGHALAAYEEEAVATAKLSNLMMMGVS